MNALKKTIGMMMAILTITSIQAQNEDDALRFSRQNLTGTSRFVSMGGAFTALGGDLSAINLNPASVGIYRKSEFSATPRIELRYSDSEFNGTNTNTSDVRMNIGNIGYLANFYTGRTNWVSASIAFGYNRTNDFDGEISYNGISNGSSLLDTYTAQLNRNGGTPESEVYDRYPFGAGLAYFAFLVNPLASDSMQYDHILQNSEDLYQEMTITSSGGSGDYYFAFGGNFNDRLYMGASLNLSSLRYNREIVYKEIPDAGDNTNDLVELRRYENLFTSGTGFNFKVGMIARLTNALRFGLTVHSPTWYRMSDFWSSQIDSDYENGDLFREESPDGEFDYRLNTSGRIIAGLGYVIGKRGLISAEYEFVDHSLARLSTPRNTATGQYDFNLENQRIQQIYAPTGVIRAGGEFRIDPFRIRAGYSYRGNSYSDVVEEDNSSNTYTFGLGFRQEGYFIDMGYSLTQFSENNFAYASVVNPASIDANIHSILFTVGFRF